MSETRRTRPAESLPRSDTPLPLLPQQEDLGIHHFLQRSQRHNPNPQHIQGVIPAVRGDNGPIPVAALVAHRCRRWAAIMGFFSGPVVGYCQHPLFGLVEYGIDFGVEVGC